MAETRRMTGARPIPADARIARYGIEEMGTLRAVLLHRCEKALRLVNRDNFREFLFDDVPQVERYLEEHERYQRLLESQGVRVFLLGDHVSVHRDPMETRPNLAYLHDIAVVNSRGAILSKMGSRARRDEEVVVKEALQNLGIGVFFEFEQSAGSSQDPTDEFEGCLQLSPEILFIAETERHYPASIRRFLPAALEAFREVIVTDIPDERRFMHPDMVLNRMGKNLAVYYPPAFLHSYLVTRSGEKEIDFRHFMEERGWELVEVSDEEQRRWGTSLVPLAERLVINYDISLRPETISRLEMKGVRFIHFHPDALLVGGGSLRCLTLRLYREPDGG